MTLQPVDYLLIGHMTADLLPDGGRTAGGTVSYAARTAHAFGLRVGLLTSAAVGEPLLDAVTPYAQVQALPAAQTTTFENLYTPEGRVQYVRGVAAPITAADIPDAWRSAPLVHLAPIAGEADTPAILGVFPDDALILLTLQGWLRRWDADGRVHFRRWFDADALRRIDVVVFSEEDVVESPGLIEEIVGAARHVFVTQAERGGLHYIDGQPVRYTTPQVTVTNPTGAGDVFATSLLAAYRHFGDWSRAVKVAAALGAQCVTREGLSGAPTADEVARLVSR